MSHTTASEAHTEAHSTYSLASLERMVRGATLQTSDMRPWWVGRCPVVANAVDWVPGVDAAAVYRVGGALVAVAAWRSPNRPGGVAWAIADLDTDTGTARQAELGSV